jgi:hypothetical protein
LIVKKERTRKNGELKNGEEKVGNIWREKIEQKINIK